MCQYNWPNETRTIFETSAIQLYHYYTHTDTTPTTYMHSCIIITPAVAVSSVQHYRFIPNCDEPLSLLYYDKTGATGTQQVIVL